MVILCFRSLSLWAAPVTAAHWFGGTGCAPPGFCACFRFRRLRLRREAEPEVDIEVDTVELHDRRRGVEACPKKNYGLFTP